MRARDLEPPDSPRHVLARLDRIRRANAALHGNRSPRFHRTDNDCVICYSRRRADNVIVCVVNLDPHHAHRAWPDLDVAALGLAVHDLLGDARLAARNFALHPASSPAHIFAIRRTEYFP